MKPPTTLSQTLRAIANMDEHAFKLPNLKLTLYPSANTHNYHQTLRHRNKIHTPLNHPNHETSTDTHTSSRPTSLSRNSSKSSHTDRFTWWTTLESASPTSQNYIPDRKLQQQAQTVCVNKLFNDPAPHPRSSLSINSQSCSALKLGRLARPDRTTSRVSYKGGEGLSRLRKSNHSGAQKLSFSIEKILPTLQNSFANYASCGGDGAMEESVRNAGCTMALNGVRSVRKGESVPPYEPFSCSARMYSGVQK